MVRRAWTRRTDCLDRNRRGGRKGPPLDHSNKRLVRHFVASCDHPLSSLRRRRGRRRKRIGDCPGARVRTVRTGEWNGATGNAMADLPVVRFEALLV
jgi:hypothetical protein